MSAHELSAWNRLLSVATLGTRRASLDERTLWPSDVLAGAGENASVELKFLRLAAATQLWETAGSRAPADGTAIASETVEQSSQPFLSEAAAMRLVRMLTGDHGELIPEWFELARSAARWLPPQFVPAVLQALKSSPPAGYAEVLGPTAQWLSKLNPDWTVTPVVHEPSQQRWQEGSMREREAELIAMRKRDAAAAREWLQATWTNEPPDARETFVRAFGTNLSIEDEPFLETGLDDKRKAVRQAAAELLAQLPDSAHAKRNLARLDPLISFDEKKGLLGKLSKRKLLIQLPAAVDKDAQRDGIEAKPPAQLKIGERAFWLRQMVAVAPPAHWTARFDCAPATFVAAALDTDYAEDMLGALTRAAALHPDRDWLHALSKAWVDSKHPSHVIASALAQMTQHAPVALRAELLEMHLAELSAGKDQDTVYSLLMSVDFPLSGALTRLAIERVAQRAKSEKQQWQHNRNTLNPMACRCDVPTAAALLPQLLASIPAESAWRNALEHCNDIVEFRAAMKRELT
jgi:hypothetical protein